MADTKTTDLTELSVPDLADLLFVVNDTGPASGKLTLARLMGLTRRAACSGRLTLTTALPVTTADVTAASTLYWSPIDGGLIGVYDGTRWRVFLQAELSLALSGLTADRLYDVFYDYNAGTPALALGTAWTNDTTRAVGLTTQDGIYVLTGTTTKRYLGTIRTTGTTTTEDSMVKRFVWNKYNAVERPMTSGVITNSHTYQTSTFREWNNGTQSTRLQWVNGEATVIRGRFNVNMTGGTTTNDGYISQGLDVTNAAVDASVGYGTGTRGSLAGTFSAHVAAGYHFLAIVEWASAGAATTFTSYTNGGSVYA